MRSMTTKTTHSRIRSAPAAGWTAEDLPTEVGTAIPYTNIQGSRVIVVRSEDSSWYSIRISCNLIIQPSGWTTDWLLGDLDQVTYYEVIPAQ